MIKVCEFTKVGFSEANAKPVYTQLEKSLSEENEVIIDFSEVDAFTTLFFNNALGKFFLDFGPDEYAKRIQVQNLSETGTVAYDHFITNAKQVLEMRKKGKINEYESIISSED